jgi:hypothetical protein
MRTLLNGSELVTDTHTIYRISTHGCTLLVLVVFFFVLHPLSHSWASTVSDLTSEPHTDMMHTHWIQTIICTIQFKRNSSQQNWTTTVFAFEYYSRSIYLSIYLWIGLDWIHLKYKCMATAASEGARAAVSVEPPSPHPPNHHAPNLYSFLCLPFSEDEGCSYLRLYCIFRECSCIWVL